MIEADPGCSRGGAMKTADRTGGSWITTLFVGVLLVVAFALVVLARPTPGAVDGQNGAGAAATSVASPPATAAPSGTSTVSPSPSVPIQMGHGGQEHPGGPSDQVNGGQDVPCPSGLECP